MKTKQHGFGHLGILILLGIVIFIVIYGYFTFQQRSNVTITNDGASFSIGTDTPAHKTTRQDGTVTREYYETTLPGTDQVLVASVYAPTVTRTTSDISCGSKPTFMAEVMGKQHIVCNQQNFLYITNFSNNGSWYQATVFSNDLKSPITQAQVTNLLASIRAQE